MCYCKLRPEKQVRRPLVYVWRKKDFFLLYISEEILVEISEVLNRPKIRERFPELNDEIIDSFLNQLKNLAITIKQIPKRFSYQRDVDDEPYINLAVEVEADYIISRDKDLLDLMTGYTEECKDFRRRFRPLKVITPVEFLTELKKTKWAQ
jgi:putative PIN family toxin of toxin-antitoxin system